MEVSDKLHTNSLTLKKIQKGANLMKNDDFSKRDERGVRKMGAYAKKYVKVDEEPGNMADLGALLDVSIEQIGNRKAGRIALYEDSKEGLNAFFEGTKQYFEYIRDANIKNEEKLIPDIEGWCTFIGCTRQSVLNYAKRGATWEEAIAYIKDCILASKKQLAYRFKIPPVVYLNDVSNNHGYLNTSEFKITTNGDTVGHVPQLSREEIAARYQSMQEFRELPEKPDLD